jgi:leader peptidase (prepilin peptidase)/N-methyltransferase
MTWPAWAALGFVLGAIAGSFLATVAVRLPRGQDLDGRSACDACGRALNWTDLIPLVSAPLQRGRCRTCGARIDPDHAAIEWGCATVGAIALGLAPGIAGAGWALFGWLLVTLAALDTRHFWLPDKLTLTLGAAGLLTGGLTTGMPLLDRVIGVAAGFGSLWAIGAAYRAVRHRDGLGLGDAKLLGAIGAWLGWQALPFVLICASIIGLIAAVIGGDVRRDRAVAFGAALAAGAVPGWLALQWLSGAVLL